MSVAQADLKKTTRQKLRRRRRALTRWQQKQAGLNLARQLKKHSVFLRSKSIAFYLPADGEINPLPIIDTALGMGKKCYLPVISPLHFKPNLLFAEYTKTTVLHKNRYGIGEPSLKAKILPAWALNLVLMPLVGFDRSGNRLGMGGGFYDRCFAFTVNQQTGKKKSKPSAVRLVGLAHKCQEENCLTCEDWDIPLHYIATDNEVIAIKP